MSVGVMEGSAIGKRGGYMLGRMISLQNASVSFLSLLLQGKKGEAKKRKRLNDSPRQPWGERR